MLKDGLEAQKQIHQQQEVLFHLACKKAFLGFFLLQNESIMYVF